MLDKLVQEALERGCDDEIDARLAPKICVVGCGGGGSNSVHRLRRVGLEGVDTIAINTELTWGTESLIRTVASTKYP